MSLVDLAYFAAGFVSPGSVPPSTSLLMNDSTSYSGYEPCQSSTQNYYGFTISISTYVLIILLLIQYHIKLVEAIILYHPACYFLLQYITTEGHSSSPESLCTPSSEQLTSLRNQAEDRVSDIEHQSAELASSETRKEGSHDRVGDIEQSNIQESSNQGSNAVGKGRGSSQGRGRGSSRGRG